MKLTVKNIFRDKTDHVTVYEPGTILDVKDKERAADLVKRGLCAEYTGKKAAAVTLGEEAPAEETPETPAEETPETPAEETPETPAEETPETPAEETPETPAEVKKPKGKKK